MLELGMSTVITSLPSCASITYGINTDYNIAFEISNYSFFMSYLCLRPSANLFL